MQAGKQGPELRAVLPDLECTATPPGHLVGGGAQDSAFVTNSQVLLVCGPFFEDGDGRLLLRFAGTGKESGNHLLDSPSPERSWLWCICAIVIPGKEMPFEG